MVLPLCFTFRLGRCHLPNQGPLPMTHSKMAALPEFVLLSGEPLRLCYTRIENDHTDQIHDETARQSRSAFGIGLSIAL